MNLKTNPELLPLVEWWEKDGKSTVIYLLVAALAVGGWYGWKHHKAAVKEASSHALVAAQTIPELEDALAKYGKTSAAGALKIRLAKAYFDGGRYAEALSQYEALETAAPVGFEGIPAVGKAQCLEALGKFAEAATAFDAFAAANTNSYLLLTAKLGAIRAQAQAGDKAKALERLAALKAEKKGDAVDTARIEATEALVKRIGKKASPAAAPVAEKAAEAMPASMTNAVKAVEAKVAATNEVKKADAAK